MHARRWLKPKATHTYVPVFRLQERLGATHAKGGPPNYPTVPFCHGID